MVLSVNVSPVSRDYDETAHVLKASRLGLGGERACALYRKLTERDLQHVQYCWLFTCWEFYKSS